MIWSYSFFPIPFNSSFRNLLYAYVRVFLWVFSAVFWLARTFNAISHPPFLHCAQTFSVVLILTPVCGELFLVPFLLFDLSYCVYRLVSSTVSCVSHGSSETRSQKPDNYFCRTVVHVYQQTSPVDQQVLLIPLSVVLQLNPFRVRRSRNETWINRNNVY